MKKKHPADCNFDYPWVLVTNVKWEAEAIEEMLKENRARANIKTTYFKKNMKAFFEKKVAALVCLAAAALLYSFYCWLF